MNNTIRVFNPLRKRSNLTVIVFSGLLLAGLFLSRGSFAQLANPSVNGISGNPIISVAHADGRDDHFNNDNQGNGNGGNDNASGTWSGDGVSNSTSTATSMSTSTATSTTPVADISIVKTIDNANPAEADFVNYTLTVSANGPATSTGVIATDELPTTVSLQNATASVGTFVPATGVWTIGDMSAGSTATLVMDVQILHGTGGQTITNTANVSEDSSETDPNLANNSSSVSLTVQNCGCGGGGGGGVPPATTSTLTVSVSGLNASDTASIAVNDITKGTTNSTSTGNGTSAFSLTTNDQYAVSATTTNPNYSEATSTGCSGTLSANATCNITFTLNNGGGNGGGTTPSSTDADIAVTKTVDNASPVAGAVVNYTITVTANGPATSTIVIAQDLLPTGLSLVNATASVGMYDMTGDWNIGTLSPNATATLQIAAQVGSNEAGQTITNTATVSELSSLVDQNPANNSSSVSINVQSAACTSNCGGGTTGGGGGSGSVPSAQLSVTKTVDNATPNAGDTINYTVTVSATGPATSPSVVTTDLLPSGLTFVSASTSVGTYDSTTGTWTLGNVAVGTSPTLVVTAMVNSNDPNGETITNTANVSESNSVNNPLTGNTSSSVSIVVGGSNGGGGGAVSGGGTSGGGSVGVGGGGGNAGGVGGAASSGGGGSTGGGQVLGVSASCGLYLDQYIHPIRKDLNDPIEVEKLQTFLNMNLGTNLPITGYYGDQTIAAVNQFQVKYHIEVLRPWLAYGLPTEYTPTSYVYKTTQRWINLIMCSSLNLPIPQLP